MRVLILGGVLEALIEDRVPQAGDDVVLPRVLVDGRKDGRTARASYEMIDHRDPESGLSAMMRGTAFPSPIICLMMARGRTAPGATPQEHAVDGDLFIEEILKRGLPLDVRFDTA